MRDEKGRFMEGESGNPGGRPRGLSSRLREATEDGETIKDYMIALFRGDAITCKRLNAENQEEEYKYYPTFKDRTEAATWLADRGFCKPAQAIALEDGQGNPIELQLNRVAGMTDEELEKEANRLRAIENQ